VTGYGTVSPENPHHRPSMVAGEAMKGMLVGGVNSNLEDSAAKAYCGEASPAKCYIDNSESYSTNEITIYWNSPLTYLLTVAASDAEPAQQDPSENTSENQQSTTEKPQDTTPAQVITPVADALYGDVNLDGTVDILVDLIVIFDTEHPYGYIAGARPVYKDGETETVAKNLVTLKEGDVLSFVCDYYRYDGTYDNSYFLGDPMPYYDGMEISNVDVGEGDLLITYRFTDIYQQQYWTNPIIG
jgi:hypothetical protein